MRERLGLPDAERVGRRGLRGRHGDREAAARPARAGGRGPRAHGDHDLGRRRPVAPGGQDGQRRREAGGLRRALARAGVRALRGRADAAAAGRRAAHAGAPGRARPQHGRPTCRRPTPSDARGPLRRAHGALAEGVRLLPRHVAGAGARGGQEPVERDDVRRGRRRPRRAGGDHPRAWPPTCAGACSARDMRGRTIGIKVRLDDWTNATRARTIEAWTNDHDAITTIALELLRAYAPARPVRLLGVRVASFEDEVAARPSRAGGSARAGGVRRAVAVAGGRLGRLVAVRRRVDLRCRPRAERLVALRRRSATRLWSLSRSSSGSYSVWSRRLRATTTPVAAVTPATPARPTIFQGTFMGA